LKTVSSVGLLSADESGFIVIGYVWKVYGLTTPTC